MRRLLALGFGLFTLGVGCLLHARAQFFVPGPALWAPGGAPTCAQKWSATQISSNFTGGGTTTVTHTATNSNDEAFASQNFTSGKYYVEFGFTNGATDGNTGFGIGNTSTAVTSGTYLGLGFDSLAFYFASVSITSFINNATAINYNSLGSGISATDRFALAIDLTNNLIWVKEVTENSAFYGSSGSTSGNPATGTNGYSLTQTGFTITAHPVVPGINAYQNTETATGYFGSTTWLGAAPSGFGQMCM